MNVIVLNVSKLTGKAVCLASPTYVRIDWTWARIDDRDDTERGADARFVSFKSAIPHVKHAV